MNNTQKLIAGTTLLLTTYLYGFKHGYRAGRSEKLTKVNTAIEQAHLCADLLYYVQQNIDNDAVSGEEFERTIAEKRAFITALEGL